MKDQACADTSISAPSNKLPASVANAFARLGQQVRADIETIKFPSDRYKDNPVGFAREILGIERLAFSQIDILEAIRAHRNVSVVCGHRTGRTEAFAIAALWFYCSFREARVLLTAVKAEQLQGTLWRAVRRLVQNSKIKIDGVLNDTAKSGLVAEDGRQIIGQTARTGEGLQGFAGPAIMVLVDEASGVSDQFFDSLTSLLAGEGTQRRVYGGNPTRNNGVFFESQHRNKALFKCLNFSSLDIANSLRHDPIPGLASVEWCEERKTEYGEDSHSYRVRVLGQWVADLDGKIIPFAALESARSLWDERVKDADPRSIEGDLQIGVDPADDGVVGDETAFAVRRGNNILTVYARRGINAETIRDEILALITRYGRPLETPRVAIDAEGGVGTTLRNELRAYLDSHRGAFTLVTVRAGKSYYGSQEYHHIRDGLWGEAAKWIKAGGAIPADDGKLFAELNAPIWSLNQYSQYKATDKKILRKELGRSTDRADAVLLAIWGHDSIDDAPQANQYGPAPRNSFEALSNWKNAYGLKQDSWSQLDAWNRR